MNGMILTGKCKEDFEKWAYHDSYSSFNTQTIAEFYSILSPSMQYGVYVDFFDSVGIYVDTQYDQSFSKKYWYSVCDDTHCYGGSDIDFDTRHEARTKAIEKANEIYNEKMVS